MSLTENKAGGAAVDPDDYNEVVDAVVALQAGGGGSQTFEKVELDIAHNTPGLVITGVEVTTLEAGDIVLGTGASFVSITEAWNGTTPTILLGIDATTASIGAGSLSAMDGGTGSGSPQEILWPALTDPNTIFNAPGAFRCGTACTIYATVSDGSGGDPESNQGAGKIVLFVSRASS